MLTRRTKTMQAEHQHVIILLKALPVLTYILTEPLINKAFNDLLTRIKPLVRLMNPFMNAERNTEKLLIAEFKFLEHP